MRVLTNSLEAKDVAPPAGYAKRRKALPLRDALYECVAHRAH